jgi:hypothetical protein
MDLFISGWTEKHSKTKIEYWNSPISEEHRNNLLKAWELRKLKGKNT